MNALKLRHLIAVVTLGACSVLNSYDDVVETPENGGGGSSGSSGKGGKGGATGEAGDGPTAGSGAQAGEGASTDGGEGGGGPGPTEGGAPGAGGGGNGPLTFEGFLQEFVPAYCNRILHCEYKLGFGVLLEITCHPSVGGLLFQQFGATSELEQFFDPVEGQECLDAISLPDCSVYNTLGERECEFVFAPHLDAQDVCNGDNDCIDGHCVFADASCGGECQPLPVENGDCSTLDCATGFFCNASSLCQAVGDAGADCATSEGCNPTLWCNTNTLKCEALPDLGDFCDKDLGGDPCRGSLVCGVPSLGADEECMAGRDENDSCSFDEPCKPGLRCSDQDECVVLSPPGGPCQSSQNCPALFECIADTCQPLPTIGDECDAILTCIQGECVAGVCELLEDGATCDGGNGLFGSGCEGYCDGVSSQCVPREPDGSVCEEDWACQNGSVCRGPEGSKECMVCP